MKIMRLTNFISAMVLKSILVLCCITNCNTVGAQNKFNNYIAPVLLAPTAFPDSFYVEFTWKTFDTFLPAHQIFNIESPDINLLNACIFYHTNLYRKKMKKQPLSFSPELRNAALFHAMQMNAKNFYRHENPHEKLMRTVEQRARYFEFKNNYVGENINKEFVLDYQEGKPFIKSDGMYFYTWGNNEVIGSLSYFELAKRIVQSWIQSTEHKKNMLDKMYHNMGCAAVVEQKSLTGKDIPKVIAVQNFGGEIPFNPMLDK